MFGIWIRFIQKTYSFVTKVFNEEGIPVPLGFTEQDVNEKTPRLFSDEMMLHYIENMGAIGLKTYSDALLNSARHDIREFSGLGEGLGY
ncbi:DUF3231 family protein [Bacillus sp. JJ1503]|uniref:DUF3231 family protein n=1 Tax=Bacillus sp. JJ1503 TaxID=3122956 RepID=UPI003000B1D6